MLFACVGTVGIEGSIYQCQFIIPSQNFKIMPLTKYSINKEIAKGKYYLVAGNRVHLADVDNDSIAEKLFNAKVKGVSLAETIIETPVIEAAIVPEPLAETAEAPSIPAKRRQS